MTTNSRLIAMAMAGLAAGFSGAGVAAAPDKAPIPVGARPVVRMTRRMIERLGMGPVIHYGYLKNPAGTVKQDQRRSIKAKNRARHRAACRG